MYRKEWFNMRVNTEDRKLLAGVAERVGRNESDLIRTLVRGAARELGIGITPQDTGKQAKTEESGDRAA